MVLKELLSSVDLSKAQSLCIDEITKVVVVYEDEHLVIATFQIVTPCFKGFNNS